MPTRIRNTNGATAKSAAQALPPNGDGRRAKWGIQNNSTSPLGVIIGNSTIWLKGCTGSNDDGTGGSTEDFGVDVWDGEVTVTGSNLRYTVFEFLR